MSFVDYFVRSGRAFYVQIDRAVLALDLDTDDLVARGETIKRHLIDAGFSP